MDLAEQGRNRLQQQGQEENPEQIALNKEALAKQLREHYQRQGIIMPEEAIVEAVDEFISGQSRFQSTLTGPQLLLARVYIRRGPILGVAALFCFLGVCVAVAMVHQNRSLRQARAGAVIQRLNDLEQRVTALRQSATTAHEDQAQIENHARQLLTQNDGLATLDATLKVWHAGETADFETVRKQADAVQGRLNEVKTVMEERSAPPVKLSDKEDAALAETKSDIDPLDRKLQSAQARLKEERLALRAWTLEREQVRRSTHEEDWTPVEKQSFGANLAAAQGSLQTAKYDDALAKLEENRKLVQGADERVRSQAEGQAKIADTSARLAALLQKVRAEAVDPQTKNELENRIKAGQIDLPAGDLETLASKLKSLEQIDAVLNASFHLRITTGQKTGVQRSLRNTRAQQWYIIVEAVDDNHKRVLYPITSGESGRTSSVSTWAEAVPDSVMQEVRKEKATRGFISNPEFGVKRRGTFQIDYSRIDHPISQITSW